ncbi:MAG TPA: hypothetical protein VGI79_03085 [Caulobacteraceae bacterium]|jgi:hypothetical protein
MAATAGKRSRHTEFVVTARQALVDEAQARAASDPSQPQPFVEKLGARNSEADLARIQAAHDELVALGAHCHLDPGDDDRSDPVPADPGEAAGMDKAAPPGAPSDISEQLDGLRGNLAALQKRQVSRRSEYDGLIQAENGQRLWRDEQLDAASDAGLLVDQSEFVEGPEHLVD